ncbi:MAG: dTDP-4-dehydrorhamnose 3,5-epimerase [Verrucomicrobia bacterium]|nr:dTDP-4-dehydrorhamnose 3,5-epimerase [Verrucomicrobiota bacterium]
MHVTATPFEGLYIIEPKVFSDSRGTFFESYKESVLRDHGLSANFVQDSQSISHRGVLRGMHWQAPPHAQTKLVRVVTGRLLDVVIDLRRESRTFKQWFSIELTAANAKLLWIPRGFAHGFLALEDNTTFLYKVDSEFAPDSERGIAWNDPEIGVDWDLAASGIERPSLSPRDEKLPRLQELPVGCLF